MKFSKKNTVDIMKFSKKDSLNHKTSFEESEGILEEFVDAAREPDEEAQAESNEEKAKVTMMID